MSYPRQFRDICSIILTSFLILRSTSSKAIPSLSVISLVVSCLSLSTKAGLISRSKWEPKSVLFLTNSQNANFEEHFSWIFSRIDFFTETLLVLTRSVHSFTLFVGRRADSDLGQQRRSKSNFIRELVQGVALTWDAIPVVLLKRNSEKRNLHKVNYASKYKKPTSGRRTSINTEESKNERWRERKEEGTAM